MPIPPFHFPPKVLLLTLALLLSNQLLSQDYYYYTSKNSENLFGILRRNLATNVMDTVVPFEYIQTSVMENQFLVVKKRLPQMEDGEVIDVFYEADVYSQEMKLLRSFDSIRTIYLTWANMTEFEFVENGKSGYYSVVFLGRQSTDLYDEITRTSTLKIPGHKGMKPAYIARSGEKTKLIGPFGDSLTSLRPDDIVSVYWQDCFKVFHKATESFDLFDLYGNQLTSDVIASRTSFDGRTTILSHSNGTQSLWYGPEKQLGPLPYEFPMSTMYKPETLVAKGADSSYYFLDPKGTIISGPYEGLMKLNGTDNLMIKEKGLWRLEGPDAEKFQDKRYSELEILEESRRGLFYVLKMQDDALAITARRDFIRIDEAKGAQIQLTDNKMIARKGEKWALMTSKGFTDFVYDEFVFGEYDSDFTIGRKENFWVLVNDDGTEYFDGFELKSVEYFYCELGEIFIVRTKQGMGYFWKGRDPKEVQFIYTDFECGDYGFCLKKNGKWGLISGDGSVTLDFTHKKVSEVREFEPDDY